MLSSKHAGSRTCNTGYFFPLFFRPEPPNAPFCDALVLNSLSACLEQDEWEIDQDSNKLNNGLHNWQEIEGIPSPPLSSFAYLRDQPLEGKRTISCEHLKQMSKVYSY